MTAKIRTNDRVTLADDPTVYTVYDISRGGEQVNVTAEGQPQCPCGCGKWVDTADIVTVNGEVIA
ncbi:hypothetical protein AMIS_19600 [Actinoplanes missouriensis 431]|uniref:Uncharacterized protein n=1 Tax=Actinoplanes missouriensis (strain ATCC 14538 / DSM 43046 / CBS 188.64 / JCM 3121 / NBRC 102363 / NCIMB 12654 / NRRL B-3342 / UNCC 431) TaxID=512565 RepID=I0H2E3_ACTM4|nr:hypothetical protein [Actinoplanes missouriensis]BAL87180.1 hypothetical protein AMIS_19600 [Actinoplanes missouriensis 431]